MLLSRSLGAVLGLVLLPPLAPAGTLTVGPAGSGAQFTEIQAAVDAALDDDVILVQPGTYQAIVVAKPLRILGDGTGTVRVSGAGFAAEIRGIAAGRELVLSHVEVGVTASSLRPVILLQNCPGTVVLHDVVLPDSNRFMVGVKLENCARAVLLDGNITAGSTAGDGAILAVDSELWLDDTQVTGKGFTTTHTAEAAPGIELLRSTLHLWRSSIRGGSLGTVLKLFGSGVGGAGIEAVDSTIDHFGGPGAEIRGGRGVFDSLQPSWPGGPALDLAQDSHARIQDGVLVAGGLDGSGSVQAPPVRVDGTSSFTRDPKVFPTLVSSAQQVQLGSSFSLTLTGNPGGYQVLFLSFRTGPTTVLRGVDGFGLLDRPSMRRVATEILPASAKHTLAVRVPSLTSLIGTTGFFQAAEQLGSSYAIGNPVLVTITR